jgi:hypothetical protein
MWVFYGDTAEESLDFVDDDRAIELRCGDFVEDLKAVSMRQNKTS